MRAPEKARITINASVEQRTQERIEDLIPAGALEPGQRFVLTNAIYFKGESKYAFPEGGRTKRHVQRCQRARQIVEVRLMNQRGSVRLPGR